MKKNEHSIQSLTNSSKTSGPFLEEYREQVGRKEFQIQYNTLYYLTKYRYEHDVRNSHVKYENDENKLKEIKEKYKNGVTKDIINEMLSIIK